MSRPHGSLSLAVLALTLALWPAPGRAAMEVILMRHADKDTTRGDFNLSPAGFARAIGLARLIPACLGDPSAITTYVLDPDSSKNARSYQTAVPLAVATGVTIRMAVESQEHSFEVGRQLRERANRSNERLVLFWEHRRMPELARGLGWEGLAPIAEDEFDLIFRFRYSSPGATPQLSVFRQSDLARLPCFRQASFPLSERWSYPFAPSRP